MTLDELVAQLRKVFDTELRAVVLYGSAAAGEHLAKRSDYNVLVIVDRLTMEHLRAEGAVAQAWGEAGNHPPLTLTTAEWRGSADIFPMEYADILERNKLLFGEPPFEGIVVRHADLRLQVEQEAMGKLLRLRRGVMATGGDAKKLRALLESSLSPVMVVFRSVVRLHGARPSTDNEVLSQEVGSRAGFDAAPFARVVRHVRGTQKLTDDELTETVGGYLGGMEHLVAYLDRVDGAA